MGQAEIFEIMAAFVAGILLIGVLSWLIGKRTMFIVVANSLLGGIAMFLLSIFDVIIMNSGTMFMSGLLGVAGVIITFFLLPLS